MRNLREAVAKARSTESQSLLQLIERYSAISLKQNPFDASYRELNQKIFLEIKKTEVMEKIEALKINRLNPNQLEIYKRRKYALRELALSRSTHSESVSISLLSPQKDDPTTPNLKDKTIQDIKNLSSIDINLTLENLKSIIALADELKLANDNLNNNKNIDLIDTLCDVVSEISNSLQEKLQLKDTASLSTCLTLIEVLQKELLDSEATAELERDTQSLRDFSETQTTSLEIVEKSGELELILENINTKLTGAIDFFNKLFSNLSARETIRDSINVELTLELITEITDQYAEYNRINCELETNENPDRIEELADNQIRIADAIKTKLGIKDERKFLACQNLFEKLSGAPAFSPWQEATYQNYLTQEKNAPNIERFADYLRETSRAFLPEQYIELDMIEKIPSAGRFPSSSQNIHASGLAHYQDCTGNYAKKYNKRAGLLASSAPAKAAQFSENENAINDARVQAFLEMLFEVDHSLELGFSCNRLNHFNVTSGVFTSHLNQHKNKLIITKEMPDKSSVTRVMGFTHISVDDQKPLNLSDAELVTLLKIHEIYQNGLVEVNCDSGVGRTGQVRLLFALLDYLSNNPPVRDQITTLIKALINNTEIDSVAAEELVVTLFDTMSNILKELRKTRYAVEAEKQFTTSFGQLFLLVATQEKLNTKENMIVLREKLGIPPVIVPLVRAATSESLKSSQSTGSLDNSSPDGSAPPVSRIPTTFRMSPRRLGSVVSFSLFAAAGEQSSDVSSPASPTRLRSPIPEINNSDDEPLQMLDGPL